MCVLGMNVAYRSLGSACHFRQPWGSWKVSLQIRRATVYKPSAEPLRTCTLRRRKRALNLSPPFLLCFCFYYHSCCLEFPSPLLPASLALITDLCQMLPLWRPRLPPSLPNPLLPSPPFFLARSVPSSSLPFLRPSPGLPVGSRQWAELSGHSPGHTVL